jgi:DNA-nicking Smr family endonuclease
MKPPRGLSPDEAAAWARLAATVKPLRQFDPPPLGEVTAAQRQTEGARQRATPPGKRPATGPLRQPSGLPPPPKGEDRGLDATWDRKLTRGTLAPDFTLDLHGHTLSSAHTRLDDGLMQAKALGARVVLVITGKSRPTEAADRGERRGAIRAKVLDWLAAGPHAGSIAAIRQAHRRHGGDGALYLVLRKAR